MKNTTQDIKKEINVMQDLRGVKMVSVIISADKKTLWVNTENGCVLRVHNIGKIMVRNGERIIEEQMESHNNGVYSYSGSEKHIKLINKNS